MSNLRQQLAVVRRQKTFLEKRVRRLETERLPEVLRVARWARRYIALHNGERVTGNGDSWTLLQLQLAVRQLDQLPWARQRDLR